MSVKLNSASKVGIIYIDGQLMGNTKRTRPHKKENWLYDLYPCMFVMLYPCMFMMSP